MVMTAWPSLRGGSESDDRFNRNYRHLISGTVAFLNLLFRTKHELAGDTWVPSTWGWCTVPWGRAMPDPLGPVSGALAAEFLGGAGAWWLWVQKRM